MRKPILLFLGICIIFAVSCSNGFDPEVSSRSSNGDIGGVIVGVGNSPDDLITINKSGGTENKREITAFIKKYQGNYYEGQKIQYIFLDFQDGKVLAPQSETDNQVEYLLVQAVLPSAKKLQISNYAKGEIRVLNMTDEGLEAYTSYILKKVSDEVLIKNKGIGGRIPALAQYNGTYSSIAKDNKVENYISIDKDGNIYFHDASVSILNGNAEIKGEKLTIWENSSRKTVFKFDQGVYRIYGADGKTDLGYKKLSKNKG